ncbi:C40 family peptidase [Alphaproteobacteria bacterium LSUCC0684]
MPAILPASTPIHAEPDRESGRETDALHGETVTLLEETGGWARIILEVDGYEGWIEARDIGTMPAASHRVISPRGLVTRTADIKSPAIGYRPMGARLAVLDQTDATAEIALPSGGRGFIPLAQITPLAGKVEDWVSLAEDLSGTPYRWGGRDTIGIDCSALVQLALAGGGIDAPRNSGDQERALGHTLAADAPLRRGDLVFWKGHVGIMRDGITLIHANMFHAMTASEPLKTARERLARMGLPITRIARL